VFRHYATSAVRQPKARSKPSVQLQVAIAEAPAIRQSSTRELMDSAPAPPNPAGIDFLSITVFDGTFFGRRWQQIHASGVIDGGNWFGFVIWTP